MPPAFARPELLATPDWLAENLSRPGLRIVDCRWRVDGSARELFAHGHIPGAVHLDWAEQLVDADDPIPFQLAGHEAFAAAMTHAGIGDGMTAVLYDDAASLYAARVWWSLQVYGFEAVRILDGGWHAWQESGRPHSSASPMEQVPAAFTPRTDPRRRLSTSDVRALLGSREVEILDTRGPAEYRGQEGNARRLGHIPGAVNVPAALLTIPGTQRFHDADRLQRLFHEAGVSRTRRVVTYDGAGIGAAKAAFVMTLLGYPDVAVYDAGWSDWGNRLDLPVDR
ncbi:MAG TPA: sulfurtransferase [Candidatus Limnocylindrales bacterium]|nr:sulfurtransferase [Candidatus Limnocylindrales bacterium]